MLEILDCMDTAITVENLDEMVVKAMLSVENGDMDDSVLRGLVDARNALAEYEGNEDEVFFDKNSEGEAFYRRVWVNYTAQKERVTKEQAEAAFCPIFEDVPYARIPKTLLHRVACAVAARDRARRKEFARLDKLVDEKGIEALGKEFSS